MLGTYTSATGGNMEESVRNISDGHAAPIQTSNTYVGLAQKSFVFASAADASVWAALQVAPQCLVYNADDDDPIASVNCTITHNGTFAFINATFYTRVNTAGAIGLQKTYFFRFIDITGDIPPQGISIYH